jgi:hypothetical protein
MVPTKQSEFPVNIPKLAEKLQALVREYRGLEVPIFDHRQVGGEARKSTVVTEPAIVWTGWSPAVRNASYGGETCTDELRFQMPQSASGAALSVYFEFAEHDLSGDCDQWKLDIRHATADEVEALRSIFSPAQHDRYPRREPELLIDGVRQRF